jgi:hypothetical protein
LLFSPQPTDTVSDKLAADRERNWPPTEKPCPPIWISDGRCAGRLREMITRDEAERIATEVIGPRRPEMGRDGIWESLTPGGSSVRTG